MDRCLVVTGGSLELAFARDFLKDRSYDRVVAVDGGLEALEPLGLVPDAVVGDLDTVRPEVVSKYRDLPGISFEIHRPEKDETDTELALLTAERMGCRQVDILGAFGGRMDHALGNIQLLYGFHRRGMRLCLYDRQNCLYLLDERHVFKKGEVYGKYISFLPLTETVTGITLRGFKYPLTKRTIHIGTSLCISNELAAEEAVLELKSGTLICLETRDLS